MTRCYYVLKEANFWPTNGRCLHQQFGVVEDDLQFLRSNFLGGKLMCYPF
jgi:hypothetical protein